LSRRDALVLTGTALLIAVVALWGFWLSKHSDAVQLGGAEPLMGPLKVRITAATAGCVVAAVAAIAWLPAACAHAPWWILLAGSAAATAGWSILLASVDGIRGGVLDRITAGDSYLADVHSFTGGVGGLLHQFVRRIPDGPHHWVTHVAGHPPGALLSFWLLDRIGLGGAGWAAALCIAGGALAVPAVLVTVRVVQGTDAARSVAPYLITLPAAIWIAVSPDAYFLGVAAWGIACLALAARRHDVRGDVLALGAGLLLGVTVYLSYGLVLLAPLAVVVVVVQHRLRPLLFASVAVGCVVAAFALGGFWWYDGLDATRLRVRAGRAGIRPYGYFLLADLAALSIAVGPAVVVGLSRLRRPLPVLPVAAAAGLPVAALSGLSRGEVERIWLPFMPWLAVATVALPVSQRRLMLTLQLLVAIVVETIVKGLW
jgi:hypothetical protein